jgi:hypothetical protein
MQPRLGGVPHLKILVFSDSHGDAATMERIVSQESPQHIIHLGDYVEDPAGLKTRQIPLTQVKGNCDFCSDLPEILTLELENVRFYVTHGHLQGVKSGYLRAIYSALEAQAQVLLFGHTHKALCFQENDLWVLNPGPCNPRGSYGVVLLDQGAVECQVKSVT